MSNKQREMFWLVGENNNGKNIVIVKTNTGKACFLQCGFTEVFGTYSCSGLCDLSFEDAFEMVTTQLPWGEFYQVKKPTRIQLDALIKYYNK